jgi:undecaprenyl-diphosphatase
LTAIIPVLVLPTSTRIRRTQPNAGAHPLQMQPILSESDGRQRRARLASLRRPLLVALAATALATAFAYLGSEVLERDTSAIDTALLRAAKILRTTHPWLTSTMRDFSGLGSVAVLLVITLATAGYLWLLRAPRTALCVLGAVASGTLADALLKRVFGRARPDATLADFSVSSMSFPSGHASMSAIVFLTVGAMLASSRPSRPERVYILAVSAARDRPGRAEPRRPRRPLADGCPRRMGVRICLDAGLGDGCPSGRNAIGKRQPRARRIDPAHQGRRADRRAKGA